MKTYRLILITVWTLSFLYGNGQTPILVTDLFPGANGAFNEFRTEVAYIDDVVIFSANDGIHGAEPHILENGTISLLIDLNTGEAESDPQGFTSLHDYVYFSAFDSINSVGIWRTDGSASGTELVVSFPGSAKFSQPHDFIVSNLNYLYFTFSNKLYKINPETLETLEIDVAENVKFTSDNWSPGRTYCTYGDGIAFITQDDKTIKLWKAQDIAELLVEKDDFQFPWIDYFGLSEVEYGLAFCIRASFESDKNGAYFYNTSDQTLSLFLVDGVSQSEVRRTIPFNNLKLIGLDSKAGYFSMNGNPDDTEILSTNKPTSLLQGWPIPNAMVNGYLVFWENQPLFSQTILVTDGTASGTSIIAEPDSRFISQFIADSKHVYWSVGTHNNIQPELWKANPVAGTSTMLYKWDSGSQSSPSVTPFCIQDNKLYFINKMDPTVGAELFYIVLENPSNIEPIENKEAYNVIYHGNWLTIETTGDLENVNLNIYDLQGRIIQNSIITTRATVTVNFPRNIYLINIEGNRGVFSKLMYIGN